MGRQLKAMLWKNWLLKIRRPFTTFLEIFLPSTVMVMLMTVRTKVDVEFHPTSAYVKNGMLVHVGQSEISPSFDIILEQLCANGEHLAFVPDGSETRTLLDNLSLRFPLLKTVAKVFSTELALETYLRSKEYGMVDSTWNITYPKVKGAIVFYEQGPFLYDYSIRLNHSWAFKGFPDVKTIMDTNGPYVNDLEMGLNLVPTLQYGYSGFLTLQQLLDSYIMVSRRCVGWHEGEIASVRSTRSVPGNISMRSSDALCASYSLDFDEVADIDSATQRKNVTGNHILWTKFKPLDISIVPFPTRKYTDNEFQSIIKTVMGVLYLLGFLYPVSRLISDSVLEKERKIKEGMHIMGLKDSVFFKSWFITYIIQFGISSLVITFLTRNTIFEYSDKTVVFVYFFLFGVSAIFLAYVITAFFTRAKNAVAVGTLAFIGAYFPYYTVVDTDVPMAVKLIASLLSPTAFALGTVNFADYERGHVGVRWTNIWEGSSGVNFLLCLIMMIVDSLLYAAAGWYLDKVLPREYGTRYRWNFLFSKNFWRRNAQSSNEAVWDLNASPFLESKGVVDGDILMCGSAFEPVAPDLQQQESEGRCIQLKKLGKVYKNTGGNCTAVRSLELTLYESQILALLGHNGAGKSTTISMLVGLIPPTSGDAFVLGKSICNDMDKIRTQLGVCPQYDILFPELTVREHLELFGALKGLEAKALRFEVGRMITEVGLGEKAEALASALSGGMKRKLSLAIALLGGSKVIILDEPTSGMDPYSMRATWHLLKRLKKGRVILLTTHSMDEADVLGDRIAIMGDGSLQCCGSSLFLKHRYGVGYTITLVKKSSGPSSAADVIFRHVPSATLLSDVGSEMSFRLPLASTPAFKGLFDELDSRMQDFTFFSDSKRDTESISVHDEISLGIESYGVSVTTLEEVFLRVARGDYAMREGTSSSSLSNYDVHDSTIEEACIKAHGGQTLKDGEVGSNFVPWSTHVYLTVSGLFAMIIGSLSIFAGSSSQSHVLHLGGKKGFLFWRHFKALFKKRAICARRDKRTIAFQLVMPPLFQFLGLLLLMLKPHRDQPSVTLTTAFYNPLLGGGGGGGPVPFNLTLPLANEVAHYVIGGWVQRQEPRSYKFPNAEQTLADAISVAGPITGPALLSMSKFLLTSLNMSYQSRYGAVVWEEKNEGRSMGYTVLHNSTSQHAGPTYINVINNAFLRLATDGSNLTIRTRNYPLPMTRSQHAQRHDINAFSAAIIVNIAFSFIPASFAVPIVKEREVKAKHQQLISGVSVLAYWMSTFVWDFISYLLPASFSLCLFFCFGMTQFVGSETFPATAMMMLAYGPAVAAATYCLTFCFSDYSVAQNVILLVHFFSGLVLMVTSFIMNLVPATRHANSILKNLFRISPGFCLADGLASLALRLQDVKNDSAHKPFGWNTTGASISYLIFEAIIYFMIVLMLEIIPIRQIFFGCIVKWIRESNHKRFFIRTSSGITEPLLSNEADIMSQYEVEEDEDVAFERQRVLSGTVAGSMVSLVNLRKVYSGGCSQSPKVAVQSLTFAISEGECFGFLGVNGAGKTTTLSILSGEESPTEGSTYIMGNDVYKNPKTCRQLIGYCPQFDALLDLLTAKEHLELYARIKGVPEDKLKLVVEGKLTEFDLWPHANRPSVALSGGNKRKLSVAVAMIGEPPIVILDEPSSGMDPVAKRFMWDVITRISTRQGKTAVILTTHSMAEAQALCTRIGIMVGGCLRCLGSPQHLKSRFGNSLELEVKAVTASAVEVENLCKTLLEVFRNTPWGQGKHVSNCADLESGSPAVNPSDLILSQEMVIAAAHFLGDEYRAHALLGSTSSSEEVCGEFVTDQLVCDGGIPIRVFCEWWLAKDRLIRIDSFIQSSFHGASLLERNGYNFRYQLAYGGASLAQVFGHLEEHRREVGIAEYSVGQSNLEAIFNSFAARH